MTGLPADAIDAAHAYDLAHRPLVGHWTRPPDDQVARLLAGAAPLIAAAQLERDVQLALHKRAVYCLACDGAPCGYDDILRPFADLLTDPEGDPT
jgi:hypothetical protein